MSRILSCSQENKWLEFEELLLESVQRRNYSATELLLQHEQFMTEKTKRTNPDKTRKKNPAPLIFAAENNHNEFLRLFIKYDYTIPEPHVTNCRCLRCQDDKLGEAINRMSILRALSNPVWIGLTSQDPFLTSFQLCQLNRIYGDQDDSFENKYEELSEMNYKLCLKLLDTVESEKEGMCIMRHKSISQGKGADLTFVSLAVDYNQKEVVSHPVAQHFVTSRVFDEIPRWKTSGLLYRILLVFFLAVLYPVTTMINVLCPSSCCSSFADISMKPFVKFINGAASFITFLVLLAIMGATHRDGIRIGEYPSAIEILVFVWLLGFCFGEFKQVYSRGIVDYFSCGWNWIDSSMDMMMLFAYVTWILLCFFTPPYYKTELVEFVDGMFALAIILSFFRVVYLCQITSYLGLLQLCLGKMVQLKTKGSKYFERGWNWVDMGMDSLMLCAYVTWIVFCFHTPPYAKTVQQVADGMFTIAIILSFFRFVYLCQITSYFGLVQLCLGRMVLVIFQFAFITLVVLLSFAVAMTYLYHASSKHRQLDMKYEQELGNKSEIYKALSKNYNGLLPTLFTLTWAGFSMADTKTLSDFKDGSLIQLWVNLLFIVYFAVSMIVLLNMLIAMMNNSYEHITNNLETEHKFSRTTLWLEYIGTEQTRPVPFNLIPNWSAVKSMCRAIGNWCNKRAKRARDQTMNNEMRKEYKEYKDLCSKLMDRYMLKKYGYKLHDDIISRNVLPEDDLFVQRVNSHFESWKNLFETECSCGGIDNVAYGQGEQFYSSDDIDTNSPKENSFYNNSAL